MSNIKFYNLTSIILQGEEFSSNDIVQVIVGMRDDDTFKRRVRRLSASQGTRPKLESFILSLDLDINMATWVQVCQCISGEAAHRSDLQVTYV